MTSLKKIVAVSALSIASIATCNYATAHPATSSAQASQLSHKQFIALAAKVRGILQNANAQIQHAYAAEGIHVETRLSNQRGLVFADTAAPSTVNQLARNTPRPGEQFAGMAVGVSQTKAPAKTPAKKHFWSH